MSEAEWRERAETAEAKLSTQQQVHEMAVGRVKAFKGNFGLRERSNGEIVVDFDKFAERIGIEGALELRKIIDERYQISGEPGTKPHMRLVPSVEVRE